SFVNELSIMASLSHPNVIHLFGFVEDIQKGDAWIVLQWQPNGNVREFLHSGEWDIPERISLIQDVANGVEYLHTREPPICHGDLKSLNILVNSSNRAMITDFGSARVQQCVYDISELTLTGPMFTLRWTAPEVLDEGMQDTHSDMWALGWICWEIMTGKLPFEGLSDPQVIFRVTDGRLPAIRDDAHLSPILTLCSVMSNCWNLKPAKRIEASTFLRKVRLMVSVLMDRVRSC
ncbi:hypothetical protein M407DRAFT_83625, partial [Tulasnella calospora MUT 4182]